MSWSIVRFYRNRPGESVVIRVVKDERDAQMHCSSPEASSATCARPAGKQLLAAQGPWFEGYREGDLR